MKVAKTFRWEAAHRLPAHDGACRNIHGHSYRMTVTLDGSVGSAGMVIDFHDVKAMVEPLIRAWDHATLVAETDAELLAAVSNLGSKIFVLPAETTAENLCLFALDFVVDHGRTLLTGHAVTRITIRVQETETCYSESEREIRPG